MPSIIAVGKATFNKFIRNRDVCQTHKQPIITLSSPATAAAVCIGEGDDDTSPLPRKTPACYVIEIGNSMCRQNVDYIVVA